MSRMGDYIRHRRAIAKREGVKLPPRPAMPVGLAQGEREPKMVRLRGYIAAEDWKKALRCAASLPSLGDDKDRIERALEALLRPAFCRQLKRDPDALIADGIGALRRRFGDRR